MFLTLNRSLYREEKVSIYRTTLKYVILYCDINCLGLGWRLEDKHRLTVTLDAKTVDNNDCTIYHGLSSTVITTANQEESNMK